LALGLELLASRDIFPRGDRVWNVGDRGRANLQRRQHIGKLEKFTRSPRQGLYTFWQSAEAKQLECNSSCPVLRYAEPEPIRRQQVNGRHIASLADSQTRNATERRRLCEKSRFAN
jgi:hypothetical protein